MLSARAYLKGQDMCLGFPKEGEGPGLLSGRQVGSLSLEPFLILGTSLFFRSLASWLCCCVTSPAGIWGEVLSSFICYKPKKFVVSILFGRLVLSGKRSWSFNWLLFDSGIVSSFECLQKPLGKIFLPSYLLIIVKL